MSDSVQNRNRPGDGVLGMVPMRFCFFSGARRIIYKSFIRLLMMKRLFLIVLLLGLCSAGEVFAQVAISTGEAVVLPAGVALPPFPLLLADTQRVAVVGPTAQLPLMSPELALIAYQRRVAQQSAQLAAYSAVTVVRAELPESSQQGEFELHRKFEAPHTLQFTPVHYSGDGFVKNNVITRLLQSEVEHVQKDDPGLTAISPLNYKFTYKGANWINNRLVHVYQVKPHKKRPGLFKGRISLDAHTGTLVRVEGSVVKSPSFFVKHIEFVQDYIEVQSFTLPVHVHSEAKARIVGRTIVDIVHRDYQTVPAGAVQAAQLIPAR
jgi:hypothetical protein